MLIFLLFFLNSFFFVYRHSDLDGLCSNGTKIRYVNLTVACRLLWVTRSDIGLHNFKHLWKGTVERMMSVLGRSGWRVVSLSPCFRKGGGWLCGE
jgi:hypothetical protein